ncbi:MAG: hypothetical protein ABSF38_19080 [Verrucomicrobiota bacterium]|jgi:hypothetical protein
MKITKIGMVPCCLLGGLLATQSLYAQITWTDEAAGVEATTVPGTITENFDSLATGNVTSALVTPIGTLLNGAITTANEYGGAGGTGNFYVVGNNVNAGGGPTPVPGILTFNSPQSYFGMWWSAADSGINGTAGNSVTFYDGATVLATLTTAQVTAGLSSFYLGNPSGSYAGQNNTQDYVYLDFYDTGGATITSVDFNNGDASNSSGFEMDNFSILAAAPDLSGTLWLLGLGLSAVAAFGRRADKGFPG